MISFIRKGGGGTDTSDATATINDVLSPKVFYNANGRQTGNIMATYKPIEGLMNATINCSDNNISIVHSDACLLCDDGEHAILFTMINNIKNITLGVLDFDNYLFTPKYSIPITDINLVNTSFAYSIISKTENNICYLYYMNRKYIIC